MIKFDENSAVANFNNVKEIPKKFGFVNLLFTIFIASFLLPLLVYLIENFLFGLISSRFLMRIVIAPFVEESGKLLTYFLLLIFVQRKINSEISDHTKIFMLLSVGFLFGLTENILFYQSIDFIGESLRATGRIISAQILHSVIPLYFLVFNKKISPIIAFLLVIVLHAVWNLFIYFELNPIFVYLFSLLLFAFVINELLRKRKWLILE